MTAISWRGNSALTYRGNSNIGKWNGVELAGGGFPTDAVISRDGPDTWDGSTAYDLGDQSLGTAYTVCFKATISTLLLGGITIWAHVAGNETIGYNGNVGDPFCFFDLNSDFNARSSGISPSTGVEYSLVVTRDGATARMWVDGSEKSGTSGTSQAADGNNFRWGAKYRSGSYSAYTNNASARLLRVFDYVLTAEQIAAYEDVT